MPISKYIGLFLFPGFILATFSIKGGNSQQNYAVQSFRVTPLDIYILEGTDTLLRCEISDQAGKVQWTKDGFALGFSAIIPGYPRYSVIGDSTRGIYNLQISNTTLDDDAEYQCQVGPAKGNPAIRANAKLNMIAAPTSIRIQDYAPNSKVEVIQKQNLTLNCVVENAKPAAEIVWFRGNMEYTALQPKVDVRETPLKTFTTTSSLIIQPTVDDDHKDFSCQAKHRALPPDIAMRANIHVSVLYPPGPPFFEGYTTGDHLRNGQRVEIACRSRGGNPPAQLIWFKNGEPVSSTQKNVGRLSENVYKFEVKATDDTANLTCEAKNILSENPLKAKLQLSVFFSPSKVNIFGPTEAVIDEPCQLSCITEPSNPAAEVWWNVDGREVNNSETAVLTSPHGGWITVSNISVLIGSNKNTVTAVCHAKNSVLKDEVGATHKVNILQPPSPPIITGYNDSQIIVTGSVHKLVCTSSNGNPPPSITWYKNDKKINSVSKVNGNTVISELTILANATDNLAQYKCLVESPAIDIPLFVTKTLKVYFPPEAVKISIQPKILRPGITATLICDSSSSNPPAVVTWWKDGIPVDGVNPSNQLGLWGGMVSALELHINITQQMNEVLYTCQSSNEAMQRSVHESVSLDILYPPKFDTSKLLSYIGVEGESLRIPLVAIGNPMTMSFTWTKDGFPISSDHTKEEENDRIIVDGSVLNILKLRRSDAGIYVCEAMNLEGSIALSVEVVVEYAPYIVQISEFNSFAPGQNAVLSCIVKGEPLTKDHVRWYRHGYDMASKTTTIYANGTSYLNIKNVQYSDIGNFTCMADNQRGAIAQRDVQLIVESAPKVEKFATSMRFAANIGDRGVLRCHAQGTPLPVFVWQRSGKEIKMYRRNKYSSEVYKINDVSWGSNFYINQVVNDDYGIYECIAKNSYGQSSAEVHLIKPTRPENPQKLSFKNIANNSIQISWIPGFDGGLSVYYRVRYKRVGEEKYTYVEACSKCLNTTISGLTSNAEYTFSVMAINDAGGSKYLPDMRTTISTNTLDVNPSESIEKNEMPNLVIVGITSAAMILLVLNAALVAWFVIRRQNKSSNECDPQIDETYSKDDNQSGYKNGNHKKATSTYLVENVDIIQSASFPPKYQESSLIAPPYTISTDYTKTLPNPKRHTKMLQDNRSKDDHMLVSNGLYIPSPSPASSLVIKGSYISSPSPAPPSDGSYFNMSDKYLSYPPVVY